MSYFGCSEDSLQTLRDNAELTFARRKNMVWYELGSIERFFKRHTVVKR